MSNNNSQSQSNNDSARDLTMVERWEIDDKQAEEAAAKADSQSDNKSDNKSDDKPK